MWPVPSTQAWAPAISSRHSACPWSLPVLLAGVCSGMKVILNTSPHHEEFRLAVGVEVRSQPGRLEFKCGTAICRLRECGVAV